MSRMQRLRLKRRKRQRKWSRRIFRLMFSPNRQKEAAAGEESRESGKKRKGKRGKSGDLDSGETANGILEVLADGYGFIRSDNYMPGDEDIYVAPSQIRKFALQTGDVIEGKIRVRNQNEKFAALLCLTKVNGVDPEKIPSRRRFEDMTPVFPDKRLRLERGRESIAVRLVDIVSPIGKGQRGMIVSPPKAGKTTLLKQVALSVLRNNPEMHIIILLIDERPEEVTDMKESIQGEQVEVIHDREGQETGRTGKGCHDPAGFDHEACACLQPDGSAERPYALRGS